MRNIFFKQFTLLLFVVSLYLFSGILPIYAQKSNPILYWSQSCKYCLQVKEKIVEEGLDKRIEILHSNVNESEQNSKDFREKLSICKLNNSAIPMLFVDGKCYQGVNPVMSQLRVLAGMDNIKDQNSHTEGNEIDNRGKSNTEKMILGLTLFLLLLPMFGIFLKSVGGKDSKKRKKGLKIVMLLLLSPFFMSLTSQAHAFCPVCTVAVGTGVTFSRYLGVDDVISGVWIGGLILSSALWLKDILKKKLRKYLKKKPFLKKVLPMSVIVLTFALFIIPLMFTGIIGNDLNKYYGIDKVVLGIILGIIAFWIGASINTFLYQKNCNKAYIPFQKVEIPVMLLLLTTIILYLIVYY